jgi:hypothetical protein
LTLRTVTCAPAAGLHLAPVPVSILSSLRWEAQGRRWPRFECRCVVYCGHRLPVPSLSSNAPIANIFEQYDVPHLPGRCGEQRHLAPAPPSPRPGMTVTACQRTRMGMGMTTEIARPGAWWVVETSWVLPFSPSYFPWASQVLLWNGSYNQPYATQALPKYKVHRIVPAAAPSLCVFSCDTHVQGRHPWVRGRRPHHAVARHRGGWRWRWHCGFYVLAGATRGRHPFSPRLLLERPSTRQAVRTVLLNLFGEIAFVTMRAYVTQEKDARTRTF